MWTRLKLDFWLTLGAVLFPLSVAAVPADLPDPEEANLPLVEIEYAPEIMLPYRDRRDSWSWIFAVRHEKYLPTGYTSELDGENYDFLFGDEPVGLVGLEGGGKYNLSFGSIAFSGSFGKGSLRDARSGAPTILELTKTSGHFGLWLDVLFKEPYVVPYAQVDVSYVDYSELVGRANSTGTSSALIGWTAGALLQLNWLDEDAALRALSGSSLNNTYLDLFMMQSQTNSKPDLSTAMSWGAALKLEF